MCVFIGMNTVHALYLSAVAQWLWLRARDLRVLSSPPAQDRYIEYPFEAPNTAVTSMSARTGP